MSKAKEDELKQTLDDRDWWQEAGNLLNLELRGWTFRSGALFTDRQTGKSLELPGSVAARLIAIGSKLKVSMTGTNNGGKAND